jgi:hypothetical protein
MPVYCYQDSQGFIHEKLFPMGEAPKEIDLGARGKARRNIGAEHKSFPPTSGWPLECIASGVNPDQAQDLRDHFKEIGVPTEVSGDGNPIYRSAGHRREALKARGFVDRASYT